MVITKIHHIRMLIHKTFHATIKEATVPFNLMYLLLNLLYYNSLADFIIISSDITLSNGISFNKAFESLKGL